ncbi:MAG: hypothetical protein ACTSXD_05095 [Candidatus Heimdallarchaeaceae archaeon]
MSKEKMKIRHYESGDIREFNVNKAKRLIKKGNWEEVKENKPMKMRDILNKGPREWRR